MMEKSFKRNISIELIINSKKLGQLKKCKFSCLKSKNPDAQWK